MMRLFIAIPIHLEMASKLYQQAYQQNFNSPVTPNWQPLKNFHITLSFLGSTSVDHLLSLTLSLQQAVRGYQPFKLQLHRIALFPSAQKPRLLAALPDWSTPLQALHRQVSQAVAEQNKHKERVYLPHITIARLPANMTQWQRWQDITLSYDLDVRMLLLYRSDRYNNRQYYRPLSGFQLGTSATVAT